MISETVFLKNFLVPIFEREGFHLIVQSRLDQVIDALAQYSFEHVLVSQDMEETFTEWLRRGDISTGCTEISFFRSIGSALMNNPVPYDRMRKSLMRVLQWMSGHLSGKRRGSLPLEPISREIRELALSLGLKRIEADGLQVAALLLAPALKGGENPDSDTEDAISGVLDEMENTLERSKNLYFPWDVEQLMHSLVQLLSGRVSLEQLTGENQHMSLAPQILALILYRHIRIPTGDADPADILPTIGSTLREMEGRFYSSEVLERYIRLSERSAQGGRIDRQKDIFIISEVCDISSQFIMHLKEEGYQLTEIRDFEEVQHLYENHRPDIIILNYDSYPHHALRFSRFLKCSSSILLYAFTTIHNPSLIMSLLDAGFNDVFTPPFNYDIIVARINSTAILVQQDEDPAKKRGLRGTLDELPLEDLMQILAMSKRNVCIMLDREPLEKALIYVRNGKIVHARCGDISGMDAVHRVMGWHDEGSFTIEPVMEYPPDNIEMSTTSLLLEGFRRLDE
jgi:hypothetical protein